MSRIQPLPIRARAVASLLLLALAGMCAAPRAMAQANSSPPERMTFQGFLVDGNGNPLGNTSTGPRNYDVIFRIMSDQISGPANWTEQQTVTVDRGNFSVLLGEGNPVAPEPRPELSSLFTTNRASERYVEITVKGIGTAGADVTILPRLRLLTSPYAFLAKNSVNAANAANAAKLVNSSGADVVTSSGSGVTVSGAITATSFLGNGSGLTSLTAGNLSGLVPDSALAGVNGAGLINLNAANIASGMLADARLSPNVAFLSANQTFTGTNRFNSLVLGPNAPLGKLEIQAGADSTGLNDGKAIAFAWGGVGGGFRHWIRTRHSPGVNPGNAIEFFINTSSTAGGSSGPGTGNTNVMTLAGNGNVGIGTSNPTRGRLEVASPVNLSYPRYGYLNVNGSTGSSGQTTRPVSVYGEDIIVAGEFNAISDGRIKNIQGHSDGAADLATLNRIEITDYTHKDVIAKGNGPQKKVIAQQVETVFPQAVSQHTDVVPDIYQKAEVKDGWVKLATNLKKGDRVRLLGDKNHGIHEVLEAEQDRFRTDFAAEGDTVFVYGREVNDFRTVDYEAIAMLNVSATQELAKRLEKLETRESHLAELEQKAARVDALERELAGLKKMVTELAEAGRTSKPTALANPPTLPTEATFAGASSMARRDH